MFPSSLPLFFLLSFAERTSLASSLSFGSLSPSWSIASIGHRRRQELRRTAKLAIISSLCPLSPPFALSLLYPSRPISSPACSYRKSANQDPPDHYPSPSGSLFVVSTIASLVAPLSLLPYGGGGDAVTGALDLEGASKEGFEVVVGKNPNPSLSPFLLLPPATGGHLRPLSRGILSPSSPAAVFSFCEETRVVLIVERMGGSCVGVDYGRNGGSCVGVD